MSKLEIISTSYTGGDLIVNFKIDGTNHRLTYPFDPTTEFNPRTYTLDGEDSKDFSCLTDETDPHEFVFSILDKAYIMELRKRFPEANYMTDKLLLDTGLLLDSMSIDPLSPSTTWEKFKYHSENQ